MGLFEDRVREKMQDPEFAAGYNEAVSESTFIEAVVVPEIGVMPYCAVPPSVEVEFSYAAPVQPSRTPVSASA